MRVTYTSILKEEYRNRDYIERLVENASIANKTAQIGGTIEIQCPFKFIKQTIYGKESEIMSLYGRIQTDCRHTITSEHIDVVHAELNGDFGMTWVNREIGKHYCVIDTMELHELPLSPKNQSRSPRREIYAAK